MVPVRPQPSGQESSHRRYKSKTSTRNSLDKLWTTTVFLEGSTERKDALREVVFFNKRVGPDLVEQKVLLHKLTGLIEKD
jgi:hypothetical protein